eukprot:3853454-Prymnesium_polylepis.1
MDPTIGAEKVATINLSLMVGRVLKSRGRAGTGRGRGGDRGTERGLGTRWGQCQTGNRVSRGHGEMSRDAAGVCVWLGCGKVAARTRGKDCR